MDNHGYRSLFLNRERLKNAVCDKVKSRRCCIELNNEFVNLVGIVKDNCPFVVYDLAEFFLKSIGHPKNILIIALLKDLNIMELNKYCRYFRKDLGAGNMKFIPRSE